MPQYDFRCNNRECPYDGFSITSKMAEVQRSYPCTSCGHVSNARVFYPVLHSWHFKNTKQTRGVFKAEQSAAESLRLANHIADNAYDYKSEQQTKKWVESGGRAELIEKVCEQNFGEAPPIVSIPKHIKPPKKND